MTDTIRRKDYVKLRDDLDAAVIRALGSSFQKGVLYRAVYVRPRGATWIGPTTLAETDIDAFEPRLSRELRYRGVFPIARKHLQKAEPH